MEVVASLQNVVSLEAADSLGSELGALDSVGAVEPLRSAEGC